VAGVGARFPDSRIRVVRDGRNLGLTARLNQMIDLAAGTLLARMDQDDICYPERLEEQVRFMQQHPEIDVVAVRAVAISTSGEAIGYFPFQAEHSAITARPWNGFHFPHPTWMGRIDWFRRHRYATYHCEDQELLLRSFTTSRFAALPHILFAYRLRMHFSWRKVLRIRWLWLRLQWDAFLGMKRFDWVVLATAAFLAKSAHDGMSALLQRNPFVSRAGNALSASDRQRWLDVKTRIMGDIRTS
jgi:glycosyltransferase involved in cell wall biosynthesis